MFMRSDTIFHESQFLIKAFLGGFSPQISTIMNKKLYVDDLQLTLPASIGVTCQPNTGINENSFKQI